MKDACKILDDFVEKLESGEVTEDDLDGLLKDCEVEKGNIAKIRMEGGTRKYFGKEIKKRTYYINEITRKDELPARLEIWETPYGNSIVRFYIPEGERKKGYGEMLLNKAKKDLGQLSGQVSNLNSLEFHYKRGFRPKGDPDATFEETKKQFLDMGGSLNMFFRE